MHIKFSGGRASAGRAAAYLTGELDSHGEEREAVIVLRGDPELVAAVADGLEFAHTYTSGVIAWAPEDHPTAAHISAVLDEFEATAWAGLDPDRYTWTAVQHDEPDGGVHVHILAARVDLETGKSLNIAPPGWERDYDPLRDWQNAEHGWARPDDPERQRDLQPGYSAYEDAASLRQGLASEHPRHELHAYLTAAVERGVIEDRAGIVAVLTEAGFSVPREGVSTTSRLPIPRAGRNGGSKGAFMSESSTRWSLSPNLRARMTEQREAIEELSGNALKQLNGNLQAAVQSELSITESVMVSHYEALRRNLARISKLVLLYYLALGGGGILGLWGIGLFWEWRIESGRSDLAAIKADIAAQLPTLSEIEQQTWGVRYQETEGGRRWLLLPPGSTAQYSTGEGVGWVVWLPKK